MISLSLESFFFLVLAFSTANLIGYVGNIAFSIGLQYYQIRKLKQLQEAQAELARNHKLGVVKNDGLPN